MTNGAGPGGPTERETEGPSGPTEQEAQGPSGPTERETQGPSGPTERETQGPSGPTERETEGPSGRARSLPTDRSSLPSYRATTAAATPVFGVETIEEFGRPMRRFPVAVSADAMALAWANREDAPHGAAVVVEREIGARGLHGRLWEVPFEDTLSCSIVLRPQLSVEEANATWLVAALTALDGAESVSGRALATLWPDSVIDPQTNGTVAAVKSEVQLGPGKVKAAVATVRLDMAALAIPRECRDELIEAVVNAADAASEKLAEGPATLAAAYQDRCAVIGQRLKIRLLPKGETRGVARSIDSSGRLELASATGMVERIAVDQLRDMTAV